MSVSSNCGVLLLFRPKVPEMEERECRKGFCVHFLLDCALCHQNLGSRKWVCLLSVVVCCLLSGCSISGSGSESQSVTFVNSDSVILARRVHFGA